MGARHSTGAGGQQLPVVAQLSLREYRVGLCARTHRFADTYPPALEGLVTRQEFAAELRAVNGLLRARQPAQVRAKWAQFAVTIGFFAYIIAFGVSLATWSALSPTGHISVAAGFLFAYMTILAYLVWREREALAAVARHLAQKVSPRWANREVWWAPDRVERLSADGQRVGHYVTIGTWPAPLRDLYASLDTDASRATSPAVAPASAMGASSAASAPDPGAPTAAAVPRAATPTRTRRAGTPRRRRPASRTG